MHIVATMSKMQMNELRFYLVFEVIMTCSYHSCRELDPQLQDELKRYLEARGIGETLTNFLVLHLQKKEQNQYVNWLQKLKGMVEEKE